jgi:hypothetical protein
MLHTLTLKKKKQKKKERKKESSRSKERVQAKPDASFGGTGSN